MRVKEEEIILVILMEKGNKKGSALFFLNVTHVTLKKINLLFNRLGCCI